MGDLWYDHAVLIVSMVGVVVAVLLTPALATYLQRPRRAVGAGLLISAVAAPAAVGSARWQVLWRALTEDGPRTALLLLTLVALTTLFIGATRAIGRLRLSALRAARLLSLLPIVALTVLPRSGAGLEWNGASALAQCFQLRGHERLSSTLVYDVFPNMMMYLLAGFLWAGTGTRWKIASGFVAASASIEVYQGLVTDRVCQITDVASNGAGAALGAAAFFLLCARPTAGSASSLGTRNSQRSGTERSRRWS